MRILEPDEEPLSPEVAAERRAFKDWVYPYVLRIATRYMDGALRDPEEVASQALIYLYWQWDKEPKRFTIGGSLTLVHRTVMQECRKALGSQEKRDCRQGRFVLARGTEVARTGEVESDDTPCVEVVDVGSADAPMLEAEGLWVFDLFMRGMPEKSRRMLILTREEEMTTSEIAVLMGVSERTVRRHLEEWNEKLERVIDDYENGIDVIDELEARIREEAS